MKMQSAKLVPWLAFGLSLALAWGAQAHTGSRETAVFLHGANHPFTGWVHFLAMLTVGLWSGQLAPPANWVLPANFLIVMVVGAVVGWLGFLIPDVAIGGAVSVIVLGMMVFAERRPPLWLAGFLVAFLALFHAQPHGTDWPVSRSTVAYGAGCLLAAAGLLGLGITIGLIHYWPAGRSALRLLGGLVAATGGYFLYAAIR